MGGPNYAVLSMLPFHIRRVLDLLYNEILTLLPYTMSRDEEREVQRARALPDVIGPSEANSGFAEWWAHLDGVWRSVLH